jgi:hypothetical protein
MSRDDNYLADAASDARDTVGEYADEILEQLLDKGEASDDLYNDYPDGNSWHHESHVDKWYSLQEAADVLNQLDEFEESDSGLWEGQDMKTAFSTCAAFTYGNAVYSEWTDLIKQINDEAANIISEFDDQTSDLETEISDLNDQAEELENDACAATKSGNNDTAVTAQGEADARRAEAERKQIDLDAIAEEKKDALRTLVDDTASA